MEYSIHMTCFKVSAMRRWAGLPVVKSCDCMISTALFLWMFGPLSRSAQPLCSKALAHTRAHTHTHTHPHTRPPIHARTHARTHTHTHAHTHTPYLSYLPHLPLAGVQNYNTMKSYSAFSNSSSSLTYSPTSYSRPIWLGWLRKTPAIWLPITSQSIKWSVKLTDAITCQDCFSCRRTEEKGLHQSRGGSVHILH